MSTWESRMAHRSAERAAADALERVDACEIGDPDMPEGHGAHHMHVEGNGIDCSCGTAFGCFSFIPDPRYWSEDPAQVAAARRDEDEWLASISCSVCGKTGVQWKGDWGRADAHG